MDVNDVKKLLKNENLVMGSDLVLKLLRENKMESVCLASNAPKSVVEDAKRYATLNGVAVDILAVPNDELGVACRKPFNIAAIGLKRATAAPKKRH